MPLVSEQTSCENPTVSVAMITYNHEKFIAQAIESVLMQQVNFPIELVIGEDCSTDGTRKIVKDYATKHPNIIRPLLHQQNLGMQKNGQAVLSACRGEYVAFLEGDDYWTNPHKLQIQRDFLDHHTDYALCFHTVERFYEDNSAPPHDFPSSSTAETLTIEDLFRANSIQTCSVLFRRACFPVYGEDFIGVPLGDWALFLQVAQHGKIRFVKDKMARYRIHSGGMWATKSPLIQCEGALKLLEAAQRSLDSKYSRSIKASIAAHSGWQARNYAGGGDRKEAFTYLRRAYPLGDEATEARKTKIARRFEAAALYKIIGDLGKSRRCFWLGLKSSGLRGSLNKAKLKEALKIFWPQASEVCRRAIRYYRTLSTRKPECGS